MDWGHCPSSLHGNFMSVLFQKQLRNGKMEKAEKNSKVPRQLGMKVAVPGFPTSGAQEQHPFLMPWEEPCASASGGLSALGLPTSPWLTSLRRHRSPQPRSREPAQPQRGSVPWALSVLSVTGACSPICRHVERIFKNTPNSVS